MKKKYLLILLLLCIFTIGCTKEEEEEKPKDTSNYKVYVCKTENETADGGKSITKTVMTLDEDYHTVSYQIINEDTFITDELYNSVKESREKSANEHTEKYPDSYKWTHKYDDEEKRSISTRTYSMEGVTSGDGKVSSEYKHYKADGTYDAEAWMKSEAETYHYTCAKEK